MIYTVCIDKDEKFLSVNFNNKKEAIEFALMNYKKYGELELREYYADGYSRLVYIYKDSDKSGMTEP